MALSLCKTEMCQTYNFARSLILPCFGFGLRFNFCLERNGPLLKPHFKVTLPILILPIHFKVKIEMEIESRIRQKSAQSEL